MSNRIEKKRLGPNTGESKMLRARVKKSALMSIDTRLQEMGVNLSEYIRWLIRQDIGVDV